ncbi:MAG: hypothetical protein V4513_02255 [Pseudomonadota bacterium]
MAAVDFIEKPFAKELLLASLDQRFRRILQKEVTGERQKNAKVQLQVLTPREREVLDGLAQGLPNSFAAHGE